MSGSVVRFEKSLADFTGAPYVVSTDCCTHAIELCFRLLNIKETRFTAYTYISVPMTMRLLGIKYELSASNWKDEYSFLGTPVWDSARCLRPNMYRTGQYQCLSFGPGKPLDNVRGGAILLDNKVHYETLKAMAYDGRELGHERWTEQKKFRQGFHYMMRYEECESAFERLDQYINRGLYQHDYPSYADLRDFEIL